MPPKAKFTREEIVTAALDIAERDGVETLTARSLGARLSSSARPIFTVFKSMEEVQSAVHEAANALYGSYVEKGLREELAFRGVGKAYIRFAAEHPRLFQLLFMKERETVHGKTDVLFAIEEHYETIILSIEDGYNVDRNTALELYFHLWVYSHGIAVLIATNVCAFSEEEITKALSDIFIALLKKIKTEGKL